MEWSWKYRSFISVCRIMLGWLGVWCMCGVVGGWGYWVGGIFIFVIL